MVAVSLDPITTAQTRLVLFSGGGGGGKGEHVPVLAGPLTFFLFLFFRFREFETYTTKFL